MRERDWLAVTVSIDHHNFWGHERAVRAANLPHVRPVIATAQLVLSGKLQAEFVERTDCPERPLRMNNVRSLGNREGMVDNHAAIGMKIDASD